MTNEFLDNVKYKYICFQENQKSLTSVSYKNGLRVGSAAATAAARRTFYSFEKVLASTLPSLSKLQHFQQLGQRATTKSSG